MNTGKNLINSWLQGRASQDGDSIKLADRISGQGRKKILKAYRWISTKAIHSPHADIQFGNLIPIGKTGSIKLSKGESYSSFILLPLLTLVTSKRLLMVGAPGRGKTSIATIMALLAGESLDEVKRSIQHGHPQLTQADLLGSPLPSNLVNASSTREVKVHWRSWLSKRVKIIDEYNRIPTKTQSSLLSLMSEGYAEMYEQTVHCEESAWYFTANDDLGGGTFPVIQALKDRIDLVTRCTSFNSYFLEELTRRIEQAKNPEELIPEDVIFSKDELDEVANEIRAVKIPSDVLKILSFFVSSLDFCRQASNDLEHQNKDTLHLSGKRVSQVCNEDCPLDKSENICSQVESGISVRAYQNFIHFGKALAYFRGNSEVGLEELQQLIPWVLFEKLQPNSQSGFFQRAENMIFVNDKAGWIRQLFEKAVSQFAAYRKNHSPVSDFLNKLSENPNPGISQTREYLAEIQRLMATLLDRNELNAATHSDLVLLKYVYSQFSNKLETQGF